jgi:hypothetical protein
MLENDLLLREARSDHEPMSGANVENWLVPI